MMKQKLWIIPYRGHGFKLKPERNLCGKFRLSGAPSPLSSDEQTGSLLGQR